MATTSHLARFVVPPRLDKTEVGLLARHLALDLLPAIEICACISISEIELAHLRVQPEFALQVRRERRRLLTVEGRREVNEWKAALTEGQYLDRMMELGLAETTSATTIIDAMKVLKPPRVQGVGQGGGGPVFAVNITVPAATTGEAPQVMRVTAPIIEGVSEDG